MFNEILDFLIKLLPQVKPPEKTLNIKQKLMFTGIVVVLYFFLYNVYAIGVVKITTEQNELLSILFASRMGSIITVGIAPIILASIFFQLLTGSGIIEIDINDVSQRARYQGAQKLLAFAIALLQSLLYATSGYVSVLKGFEFFVAFQFFVGAVILMLLDEAVAKHGIGSGISLFIACGVAFSLVGGFFRFILPNVVNYILQSNFTQAAYTLLPLFFSILVIAVSIYAYKIKVEVPISFQLARGYGGRFPIPLLYVSNLPVILASSLIFLLSSWFMVFANSTGIIGSITKFFAYYTNQGGRLTLSGGLLYLISPNFPVPYFIGYDSYLNFFLKGTSSWYFGNSYIEIPEWVHVLVYLVSTALLCAMFGLLWIETTGQNPEEVAKQMHEIGWQIPGYRRDPRVIQKILENYIPVITILGSIFVGLLAGIATLTGALGTGMGLLLLVGIINDFSQRLEAEGFFELYPSITKFIK
jgi:preprotein translocase subunit SecY